MENQPNWLSIDQKSVLLIVEGTFFRVIGADFSTPNVGFFH